MLKSKQITQLEYKERPVSILMTPLALIFGFIIGAIILYFGKFQAVHVLYELLRGAFGSYSSLARTLRWATPIIFTGLAATIGFKAGIFNAGIEGQMYFGAFASAWVGFTFSLPPFIHILLAVTVAGFAGLLYSVIPAYLRLKFNVSEIVTGILLNYTAIQITDYLTLYHFLGRDVTAEAVATPKINISAVLPQIMSPYKTTIAFYGAIILAIFLFILVRYTTFGYEIHLSGLNPTFANYGGIKVNNVRFKVFLISGFISGLAGASEILGVQGRFLSRFDPGFGFEGFMTCLMAGTNPLGVIVSSIIIGGLQSGALMIERLTNVPRTVAVIIQGTIILLISAQGILIIFKKFYRKVRKNV